MLALNDWRTVSKPNAYWRCQNRFCDGLIAPRTGSRLRPARTAASVDYWYIPEFAKAPLNSGLNAPDQIARMTQAAVECREAQHGYEAMQSSGKVKHRAASTGNECGRSPGLASALTTRTPRRGSLACNGVELKRQYFSFVRHSC
jgi:hypothetical protein